MRIAVVAFHSSPLLPPGTGDSGGMSVYIRELAATLAERGTSTDVFTRRTGPGPQVVHVGRGVRVVNIDAGPAAALDKADLIGHLDGFAAGVRAFAASQRIGYDLVHSHYWQSGLAATQLAAAWDVPLVHSHHTLGLVKNLHLASGDVPEPQSRLEGERAVIARADILTANTDAEVSDLSCLYGAPHDRIKTIPPGVDHSVFHAGDRPAARERLGVRDEAVLLCVGRIQPLKGIDLALRSAEELTHALERDVRVLVVGGPSGPRGDGELARLRALASELGIAGRVSFLGPRAHDDLAELYRAADVVMVGSHTESFGFAALEAHACGTPVVGTAVGGLSFIVEDGRTGFLFSERDPGVCAAHIKMLLTDPDLHARFSAQALERAAHFTWSACADSYAALYDCLVRERLPEVCTC